MKRIALLCFFLLSILPLALAQPESNQSQPTCALTSGGTAATNALAKFTAPCNVEASAISDAAGRVGIGGTDASSRFYVTDSQTNFTAGWLLRNVFPTTVTANGNHAALGLDMDVTGMTVSAGVTDSGYRLALRGMAYANNLNFAGTLTTQYGLIGQAGILQGKSGAKVINAYGGQFSVFNRVPGTTISNAYGVYISNADTSGTITNRYDLYASSSNAKNYFAGSVGIGGDSPRAKLYVDATGSSFDNAVWGTGSNYGVYGNGGYGVLGEGFYGVWGHSNASLGTGVYGVGYYGVFGQYSDPSGYAGYFNGNVNVTGTLTKGSGSFKIDNPLDPANKYLYHSFVESPDMMNVYNGNVVLDSDGTAWITLPDYFEALNRDFRYQLTAVGAPGPNLYVAQEIEKNRFQIAGGASGGKVSWQVTGIRQDPYAKAHPIIPEVEKKGDEKGKYLHPVEYGQPESMGIKPVHAPKHDPAVLEQRN